MGHGLGLIALIPPEWNGSKHRDGNRCAPSSSRPRVSDTTNPRLAGRLSRFTCKTWISVIVELRPRCSRRRTARLLLRRTLEIRTTRPTLAHWTEWGPRAVPPGAHRDHRRRPAPVLHEAVMVPASVVMPTAAVPARVGAEDEAGEEDRADDEDDTCHDAHPGSDRGEPAVAVRLDGCGRWCGGRRCGGGHGVGRGFGGRRCFTHETD